MKHLLLLLSIVFLAACQPSAENKETAETTEDEVNFYGEEISVDNPKNLEWLTSTVGSGDSIFVKVSGEITSTCAMKGCWMKLKGPDGDVRVVFKDYEFFVPTSGVEGKEAVLEGYAVRKVTDVETLRHLAKDAGKSDEEIAQITEPKEELTITANGVAIR